ncbi:MAG: nucleotidyltransferase family protein [Candidatus Omnitrophota bacterium]
MINSSNAIGFEQFYRMDLTARTAKKPDLRKRFYVKEIGIFGSYVKKENSSDSDLDILVGFDKVPGLFSFCKIKELLNRPDRAKGGSCYEEIPKALYRPKYIAGYYLSIINILTSSYGCDKLFLSKKSCG